MLRRKSSTISNNSNKNDTNLTSNHSFATSTLNRVNGKAMIDALKESRKVIVIIQFNMEIQLIVYYMLHSVLLVVYLAIKELH